MMRRVLALAILVSLPLVSFAQTVNLSPIQSLLGAVAQVVGALVPILVTLALVVFFWGLVRYLWGAAGKGNHDKGRKMMGWGLVTLFVMVSVWGIIDLMQTALNIDKNAQGRAPQIMYPGASGYTSTNNSTTVTGADRVYNIPGQSY